MCLPAPRTRRIFLNSLSWYAGNGIGLRARVRVDRIDCFAKLVHADDGSVTPYDKLVIATGSRPFVPPIDGMYNARRGFHQGVFTFRTIDEPAGWSGTRATTSVPWSSAAACSAWRPPAGCSATASTSRSCTPRAI